MSRYQLRSTRRTGGHLHRAVPESWVQWARRLIYRAVLYLADDGFCGAGEGGVVCNTTAVLDRPTLWTNEHVEGLVLLE